MVTGTKTSILVIYETTDLSGDQKYRHVNSKQWPTVCAIQTTELTWHFCYILI